MTATYRDEQHAAIRAVSVDDCQVDEIQMRREGVHKGGKVQVWVWGIES